MAQTNILIGIGGTGAKVVESALMLFSAGIGPSEVHVGLIDQDGANGNGARTEARFNVMAEFGRRWGALNRPNYVASSVANGADGGTIALNGVRVVPLFEDGRISWAPDEDGTTLAGLIGRNLDPARKALFDHLFMPTVEEQRFNLTKGYRGRANVGSAAMMAAMLAKESLLVDRITELMEGAGDREEVRVFVVGSAFGGTGAAGFPTLARELHRIRARRGERFRGRMGGILMLPYFSFPARFHHDEGGPDEQLPVVTADELMPKAKISVEYYSNLFQSERTFDQFYTVGWDPFFSLGYFEEGAGPQRNPPLVPELVTATAIADFFERPGDGDAGPGDEVPIYVSAREKRIPPDIRWSDLPRADTEARLGQLIRFAAYWLYKVKPALRERRFFAIGGGPRERWLRELGIKSDIQAHLDDEKVLDDYLRQLLVWAAGMERWSADAWRSGLWTLGGYLDATQPLKANTDRVLAATGTEQGGEVVRDNEGRFLERRFEHVYSDLAAGATELAAGPHKGLGRAVAAAFRSSRPRD